MRLKRAIQALKAAPNKNNEENGIGRKPREKNVIDRIMFVTGPAMDIFPMSSLRAGPEIITAPGEMILKTGEIMEISVMAAPINVSLNSAHKPLVWAATLWAISCTKKDAVRITAKATTIKVPPSWLKTSE